MGPIPLFKMLEKYGLLIMLIFIVGLFAPDFTAKSRVMELDLGAEQDLRTSSSMLKQLFFILIGAGYIACAFTHRSTLQFIGTYRSFFGLFAIIFGVCIVSALWSNFPSLSIKRSLFQILLFISTTLSVYFAVKHQTYGRCIFAFIWIFIAVSIFSLGTGNGFLSGAFTGWAKAKNNYGAWCLFAIFLLFLMREANPSQNSKNFLLLQIPVLFFLGLSQSKTSIALVLVFYLAQFRQQVPLRFLLGCVAGAGIGLFLLPLLFTDVFGVRHNIGTILPKDALTGRGIIWALLYSVFTEPKTFFLGAGYATFFNTGTTPDVLNIKNSFLQYLNSAHNGYLELALQFGIPISIFLVGTMFTIIKRLKKAVPITICALLFIYNMTESAILRDHHIMWFTFYFAVASDLAFRFWHSQRQFTG